MNPGVRARRSAPCRSMRERRRPLVRLVARRQRADDLDQLHERHRIEEVEAAESIRPLGRGRDLGDAERRRVGREIVAGADRPRPGSENTSRFTSMFSTIASTTRSQSLEVAELVVPVMLPRIFFLGPPRSPCPSRRRPPGTS